jgi:GT2 family glycosyltransferase
MFVSRKKVNIIIPSINFSEELAHCLSKLNNQIHKNFFVTIVLNAKSKKKILKSQYKYKLNTVYVKKNNMSYKRNLAAKKYKSDLIAFIDSDTYCHKNWLRDAIKIISQKGSETILGGPNIPFPKQSYQEMLCYYAKRSFFVTGYLNFRKYKSKSRYCDWLESCNILMDRNFFLMNGGMNENIYLGEDKEFQERFKKKKTSTKIFFSRKIYIYHKERKLVKFLLQRFVYGTDLFNITGFEKKIVPYQPVLPLVIFIGFFSLFFLNLGILIKFFIIFILLFFLQILIAINISKYLKNVKDLFLVTIIVNLANIAYAIGGIVKILNIENVFIRKTYLRSRNNN